jgi:hypothetical protein
MAQITAERETKPDAANVFSTFWSPLPSQIKLILSFPFEFWKLSFGLILLLELEMAHPLLIITISQYGREQIKKDCYLNPFEDKKHKQDAPLTLWMNYRWLKRLFITPNGLKTSKNSFITAMFE